MSSSTDRRRPRRATLVVLVIACGVAAGCSAADPTAPSPTSALSAPTNVTPPPSPSARASRPARPTRDTVADSFAEVAEGVAATVSVSVSSGKANRHFGSAVSGPAWSTMKVPLAIAAIRHPSADTDSLVTAAITQSDNASAEALWSSLGAPEEAAASVDEVLRDAEDSSTQVESSRIRSGFTAFGQTLWPTDAQANFAWRLPCIAQSASVLRSMRNVTAGQQWGLARSDDAAVKGGWGPDPDGNYLVRQIGLMEGSRGSLGVSIAVRPDDGSFASGVAAIDVLAQWVIRHRASFTVTGCTRS